MKKLLVKPLSVNSRGFTHMAIEKVGDSVIYLHGLSKTGENQWYESKGILTTSTAHNYYYSGQYKVVFAQGLQKSTVTDWI